MRKSETPGCNCWACRRGRRTNAGHATVKAVTRRLRRLYKLALRRPESAEQIVISTPYTD